MEIDSQPNELSDEDSEENHSVNNNYSYRKRITLSTGEKLVHRKVEFVLRYLVANKHEDPEANSHHLLLNVLSISQNNLKHENHSHIVQNY